MKLFALKIFILTLLISSLHSFVLGQTISSAEVDNIVIKTMKTFSVPGIAVAIVKDGKVIHAKGYGVRSVRSGLKVDKNTTFGIASNSKAFTAAALGILVDEGKLQWDSKVVDFIPEFKMYDAYVTNEFTIRDLLTHRSGLGLGAGDLMLWPAPNDFTVTDVIYNLRFLKPVSGFRSKYDYDNLLYIVAGEVIARVSGKSWEEFIETQILQPLGMVGSASSFKRLKDTINVIDPHVSDGGKVKAITRNHNEITNAAGGIYSNVADLSKWAIMHLNHGKIRQQDSLRLLSDKVQMEMWTPQTILPVKSPSVYNTQFASYGLGWRIIDVKGHKQVYHGGELSGMISQITMLPGQNLGIIVLTNHQVGAAVTSITNTIKDRFLGISGIDHIKQSVQNRGAINATVQKHLNEVEQTLNIRQKQGFTEQQMEAYTGIYSDNWFGEISITVNDGKLWFASKRSPRLTGPMFPYKEHTFVVKWADHTLGADAFVMFTPDETGNAIQIKMKPVSPNTDFSFDFQDLDFTRVEP